MRARSAVFALAAFLCAADIQADNSTCAGAVFVVPDGSTHEGTVGPESRWFRFEARTGRSYAVMVENLTAGDEQAEIAVGALYDACGGATVPVNDLLDLQEPIGTRGTGPFESGIAAGAARVAVKAAADGELFFAVTDILTTNPAKFRIRVEETTLFGPLWSTQDGFSTHYRLYNTTNRACTVTLDLRTDRNGAPAGGSSSVTFTLAANNSVTRRTGPGDITVHAGQTGHATIAHDCTPGAILADAFLVRAGGHVVPLKLTNARQQR